MTSPIQTSMAANEIFEQGMGPLINPEPDINQNPYFFCQCCLLLARRPVFFPCNHVICNFCMGKQIKSCNDRNRLIHCPYCRTLINNNNSWKLFDEMPADVKQKWLEVRVGCKFSCGLRDNPIEMDEHEELYCPNRPVHCRILGCPTVLPFHSLFHHEEICIMADDGKIPTRQIPINRKFIPDPVSAPTQIPISFIVISDDEEEADDEDDEIIPPSDDEDDERFAPTQPHEDSRRRQVK